MINNIIIEEFVPWFCLELFRIYSEDVWVASPIGLLWLSAECDDSRLEAGRTRSTLWFRLLNNYFAIIIFLHFATWISAFAAAKEFPRSVGADSVWMASSWLRAFVDVFAHFIAVSLESRKATTSELLHLFPFIYPFLTVAKAPHIDRNLQMTMHLEHTSCCSTSATCIRGILKQDMYIIFFLANMKI